MSETTALEHLRELHLEMGQQCNVRCAMCFQTDFRPSTRMPTAIWRDRLANAYGVAQYLTLVGGEPTIIKGCRELVEMIMRSHSNIRFNMATNGMQFGGIWEDAFLSQGYCLNFSLNAALPETYARIVKYGDFDRVTANIQRFVQRKAATGSPVHTRISMIAIDETIDEMSRFIQWGADHGLDEVSIMIDSLSSVRLEPTRVQRQIADAYDAASRNPGVRVIQLDDFDRYYAIRHRINPVRTQSSPSHDRKPCPIAFDALYVHSDGWVKPCCKSWYLFGNLYRNTLEEIWNGPAAMRFRKRIASSDYRDCHVGCDLNINPIDYRHALARKAVWVVRRDPRSAVKKGFRKLGLTSAQGKKTKS